MVTVAPRPKLVQGPSKHVYDVIVLGAQLGGPLCAALLAKKGYRVMYVEHDGLGPGYAHEGYLLPFTPFLCPPLKGMPVVEEMLHELGLNTTVARALKPHTPELQLVFPQHRVDLPADGERRSRELQREFGDEGLRASEQVAQVAAQHELSDPFFKTMPELHPEGTLDRWRFKRALGKQPELMAPLALDEATAPGKLLLRFLPFVTFLDEPEAPLARTRPLSQVLRSPHRYPGGREGLRELLTRKLIDLGGNVLGREGSEVFVVDELEFDGKKLVGLRVLRSENVYRASYVVAATDAGALRRLVPDKKAHRDLAEQLDEIEPRRFLFTVNWVLPADLLPRGMGDLVLIDGDEDPSPVLVQVLGARKVGADHDLEDVKVLCAGAFVAASDRELGEAHLQAIGARIEAKLDALLPFCKAKTLARSMPYLDASPVRGSRLMPHPLYRTQPEPVLGVAGLSPRTSISNFFLASREVLPGLGIEGELLAGVQAANLIHDAMNKKDPLKR